MVEETGVLGENYFTCRKSLTNFITWCCIEFTSPWTGFELTTSVVIARYSMMCMWFPLIILNRNLIYNQCVVVVSLSAPHWTDFVMCQIFAIMFGVFCKISAKVLVNINIITILYDSCYIFIDNSSLNQLKLSFSLLPYDITYSL